MVARSSWALGFQLVLSADISPATAVPSAVVISTDVRVPLVTATWAALLMEALFEPSPGVILIWASEVFAAAASSALACEVSVPLSPLEALSLSPPLHAESTSTPPSRADAAMRPLRRLLSVITRFSIVAESPNRQDHESPYRTEHASPRNPLQRYDRFVPFHIRSMCGAHHVAWVTGGAPPVPHSTGSRGATAGHCSP